MGKSISHPLPIISNIEQSMVSMGDTEGFVCKESRQSLQCALIQTAEKLRLIYHNRKIRTIEMMRNRTYIECYTDTGDSIVAIDSCISAWDDLDKELDAECNASNIPSSEYLEKFTVLVMERLISLITLTIGIQQHMSIKQLTYSDISLILFITEVLKIGAYTFETFTLFIKIIDCIKQLQNNLLMVRGTIRTDPIPDSIKDTNKSKNSPSKDITEKHSCAYLNHYLLAVSKLNKIRNR